MNPFKDAFTLGQRFRYLGNIFIVVYFIDGTDRNNDPLYKNCGITNAKMNTHYMDKQGILHEHMFKEHELTALLVEVDSYS